MRPWKTLTRKEQALIVDLKERGPDCAKFLARRMRLPLRDTVGLLEALAEDAWIGRVQGTFLYKRGMKQPKHMNHTYFKLTRFGDAALRDLARRGILCLRRS
jgi:predicted transcriptional regulator